MCASVLAIALFLAASPASAEVEVRGERSTVNAKRLDELVGLELGGRAEPSLVVVEIAGDRAEIEIRSGAKSRRGAVDLGGAGDVERTLALFIGELARTSEPPPREDERDADKPQNDEPRPRVATAPPPEGHSPYVLASGGVRWLPASPVLAVTPHLEAGVRFGPSLRLGAIARYVYASSDDALGTARAHAITGGLGATYSVFDRPSLALATGPRGELGAIFGRGDGLNGASTSGLVASAAWAIEVQVPLAKRFRLFGSLDGGFLLRGLDLRADDRTVLDVSGVFVGVSAGFLL